MGTLLLTSTLVTARINVYFYFQLEVCICRTEIRATEVENKHKDTKGERKVGPIRRLQLTDTYYQYYVYDTMYMVLCIWYYVCDIMYTILCIWYYVYDTMYAILRIYGTMYVILCIWYYVWDTMYMVLCIWYYECDTMCTILCIRYCVYDTMYTVLYILILCIRCLMGTYCLWGLYSMLCGDLNRKEIQKEGIYVYVKLTHFAVQQKLTQHCKATIFQWKLER